MANSLEVPIPQEARARSEDAERMLSLAIDYTIVTDPEYERSGGMLAEVASRYRELDTMRKSITKPLNDGLRRISAFFEVPLRHLAEARRVLESSRSAYRARIEEETRMAEARAEEAARKERDRLEREAAAIEEAARIKRERGEARIMDMEAAGKAERADAARAAIERAAGVTAARAAALRHVAETWPTAPIIIMGAPKTAGVHTSTRWRARVTDKTALIAAVASGLVPEAVLVPDMVALNRMVTALRGALNMPGVIAEKSESETVRTSK